MANPSIAAVGTKEKDMHDSKHFDLIVIGAGTDGTGVARMTVAAGWKVVVDHLPCGGTCALRGCDPKKMLIAVTEGVDWARNGTEPRRRSIANPAQPLTPLDLRRHSRSIRASARAIRVDTHRTAGCPAPRSR